MAQQKIRIEDNLWYLRRLVALVADAARIQPDPDLFADRVLEDIRSARSTLGALLELLRTNTRLMDRGEYLVLLGRSARALADAVSDLAAGDGELSRGMDGRGTDLAGSARELGALVAEIRDLADAVLNEGAAEGDVVSGDELSELLREEAP